MQEKFDYLLLKSVVARINTLYNADTVAKSPIYCKSHIAALSSQ